MHLRRIKSIILFFLNSANLIIYRETNLKKINTLISYLLTENETFVTKMFLFRKSDFNPNLVGLFLGVRFEVGEGVKLPPVQYSL